MNRYFIIHGSFSSPYENWFPWLFEQIEKTKPKNMEEPICYCPQMPTGVGLQTYENWSKVLSSYAPIFQSEEDITIFAHSIAPVFVCKFLIEHKLRVKRLVFVCGFNGVFGINADYDTVNSSMYIDSLADVKKFCDEIVCLYSDNDPYVPFQKEKSFADTIATRQIIIKNGGHLNASSRYLKFPQLLEFI